MFGSREGREQAKRRALLYRPDGRLRLAIITPVEAAFYVRHGRWFTTE
jgi:hypothetical protein